MGAANVYFSDRDNGGGFLVRCFDFGGDWICDNQAESEGEAGGQGERREFLCDSAVIILSMLLKIDEY